MTKVSMHATSPMVAWGRQLLAWLTGTGFLTLHAAAFFIALVILIPWNLYRSPGDFWVAEPLRSWAFLLAFHAVVVGAISLARGIVKAPTTAPEPAGASGPMASWRSRSSVSLPVPSVGVAATSQSEPSSAMAEEWARRWLDETASRHPMSPAAGQNPGNGWALGSGHPSHRSGATPGFGGVTPGYIDIEADGIDPSTYAGRSVEWPPPPSDEPRVIEENGYFVEEDVQVASSDAQRLDPLRAAADVQRQHDGEIDAELEWQWVEAAASAWLSRRTEPGAANGHNGYHGPPPPEDSAHMP